MCYKCYKFVMPKDYENMKKFVELHSPPELEGQAGWILDHNYIMEKYVIGYLKDGEPKLIDLPKSDFTVLPAEFQTTSMSLKADTLSKPYHVDIKL